MAERRLGWIDQRQAVLAQNIANANTPGYQARDVKPFADTLAAATRRAAGATQVSATAAPPDRGVPDRSTSASSLDGNAVTLDDQLEKVAETDTAHQLAMNLYRKYEGLFRTAIGRS